MVPTRHRSDVRSNLTRGRAFVLIALAACSTGRGAGVVSTSSVAALGDSLSLQVQNLSPANVTVFLQNEPNGERTELGPVRAGSTRLFRVPYAEQQVGLSFDVPAGPPPVSITNRALGDPILDDATRGGRSRTYWKQVEPGMEATWVVRQAWPISVGILENR